MNGRQQQDYLALFDGARVFTRGGEERTPRGKPLALLVHLALEHDHRHSRRSLAALLWPDLPPDRARSNLRVALHKLRDTLDPTGLPWLEVGREDVMLRAGVGEDQLGVDVLDLIDHRLPPQQAGPIAWVVPSGCPAYEEWASSWRERVGLAWTGQLEDAARVALADERWEDAEALGRSLIQAAPLVEAGYELAGRALLARGLVVEARQLVDACAETLEESLGITPSAGLVALVDAPSEDRGSPQAADLDPNQPLDTVPLPPRSTVFHGRVDEVERISATIRQRRHRLLTLVGPGGMGKSRLSLEVADRCARLFEEGAVLVELAGLQRVGEVPLAMATALGLHGVGSSADPLAALLARLREREVLIVVDNAEHLVGGEDRIEELLQRLVQDCPHVVCLVSSRQALRVSAEDVTRVGGLAYPLRAGAGLEGHDAIRMLVERLHRVDKRIRLDEGTAEDLVRICRSVEGMPLGLELAASAVQHRPLRAVARALEESPGSLVNDFRDGEPRHADLGRVYGESVMLLPEADRRVMERLGIFRGGFGTDAARALALADAPTLARLCRATLVERDPGGRYRVHELLRQLAEQALDARGEATATRARHRDWFLGVLADAAPRLNRAGAAELISELETDTANHTAAWRHGVETGAVDLLLAASAGLVSWSVQAGTVPRVDALVGAAVEVMPSSMEQATMLMRLLSVTKETSDDEELLVTCGQVVCLAGDGPEGAALRAKARLLRTWVQGVEAVDSIETVRSELGSVDDPVLEGFVDLAEAFSILDLRDVDEALECFARARDRFASVGHVRGEAQALKGLGHALFEGHRLGEAMDAVDASLALFEDLGSIKGLAYGQELVGEILLDLGCADRAVIALEAARAGWARTGLATGTTRVAMGRAMDGIGDPVEAEKLYTAGLQEMALAQPSELRLTLFHWGRFLVRQGRGIEAELVAEDLVARNAASDVPHLVAAANALLARALLLQGNIEEAERRVDEVLPVIAEAPLEQLQPLDALLDCIEVLRAAGRDDGADEALAVAVRTMKDMGRAIADPALRRTFLTDVRACRRLRQLGRTDVVGGQTVLGGPSISQPMTPTADAARQ